VVIACDIKEVLVFPLTKIAADMSRRLTFVTYSILLCQIVCFADEPLATVNRDPSRFAMIDTLVNEGVSKGDMAGAVVVVASKEDVLYAAAFGQRQIEPVPELMTLDTVFDLASLTKPIATATSTMILVDQGLLDVTKPVQTYLPEFGANGKDKVTVEQLLVHTSGLIPDNALSDYKSGIDESWKNICALDLKSEPGASFAYSDVNFIVLGKLIEKLSGEPVDKFAAKNIFAKLGMDETTFNPNASLQARAATTEKVDGVWLKGQVHDPRAALLDGVAGHAGLFSTAKDLVKLGQTMLSKGKHNDVQIFTEEVFAEMTRPRTVPRGSRTLGWDHRSPYSANRGDHLSESAFGHGGFTGTVLWIDPEKDLVFIFLSNRLHPDGMGNVNILAGKIASIVTQ